MKKIITILSFSVFFLFIFVAHVSAYDGSEYAYPPEPPTHVGEPYTLPDGTPGIVPPGSTINPNTGRIDFPPGSAVPGICINELNPRPPYGGPPEIPPPPPCVGESCGGGNPTVTPTPGGGKVCNDTCTDTSQCGSGLSCLASGNGNTKACRLPSNPTSPSCSPGSPTATPIPSATATPVPSVTATPIPSATATPVPSATSTPVPTRAPSPTPNPFSQTMCKCDGITLEPAAFIAGQKLTVTAYAKVEGGDTSYATVPNMLFTSEHYTDPAHGIRDIPYEVPIATTIVEQSSSRVRYKAVWTYTVPANPDPNLLYKVRAVPQCVQKTAGIQNSSRIADTGVAPVSLVTQNKNIIQRFFNFVLGIFSKKPASTAGKIQSGPGDNLQLDTLKTGTITGTDYCSYIEYRVQ